MVLIDMTMPEMEGKEAIRRLHHLDRELRCILMSGYSKQSAMDGLPDSHLVGFLEKPFGGSELLDVVRGVLPGPVPAE